MKNVEKAYGICPTCNAVYPADGIRHHRCNENSHLETKDKKCNSKDIRAKSLGHMSWQPILLVVRSKVLGVLRDDKYGKIVRNDEGIIEFGNQRLFEYTKEHL